MGGRDSDGEGWHDVRRRRGKALGQGCSNWDRRREDWQLEERVDYGHRQSRVNGATVWQNNNRSGTFRGTVLKANLRSSHQGIALRRSEGFIG